MNPERFKSDKIIVSDTDGTEVDLPLVFHRNLSAAYRLSHAFERKYLSKFTNNKEKTKQSKYSVTFCL